MNKDNAKDYLPIVQALADGKQIQRRMPHCFIQKDEKEGLPVLIERPEEWVDDAEGEFSFYSEPDCYRIKPDEPRTFDIARRKSDGLIKNHAGNFINNEWERITVQEVLK
jgi:hypothetical protein